MVQCGPLISSYSGIDRKLFINPIRFDIDILQRVWNCTSKTSVSNVTLYLTQVCILAFLTDMENAEIVAKESKTVGTVVDS